MLKSPIIALILLMLAWSTVSCGQFDPVLSPDTENLLTPREDLNDASINDFQMLSYNQSILKWEVKSTSASIFNDEKRTYLSNVSLTYYDINRQPTSFVVSDEAIMETDTQNIELMQNVLIRNIKGTMVSGQYFYWDNTTEKLTSPQEVVLRKQNGFSVSGVGFSATKDLEAIIFDSEVSGEIIEGGLENDKLFDVGF